MRFEPTNMLPGGQPDFAALQRQYLKRKRLLRYRRLVLSLVLAIAMLSSSVIFFSNTSDMKLHPKSLLMATLVVGSLQTLQAQNVGVGTATPHPSAKLDVTSTNSGLLPPRLTTAQRDAIPNPSEGLTIFNTDNKCMEYWNSTKWISTCETVPLCSPPPAGTPNSNTPLCEGQTLMLTSSAVPGASYIWSGPGGFTANGQNVTRSNISLSHSGTYTLRTWALGCYSEDQTTSVAVLPKRWERRSNFPAVLQYSAGFVVGGYGYMGTGTTSANSANWCTAPYSKNFYRYDPAFDVWTSIAPLPAAASTRFGASSFALDGFGYVGGGIWGTCSGVLDDFYRYDPSTDTWTSLPAITQRAEAFNQLCVGTDCYFGTGRSGLCNTVTFQRFNAATNTFSNVANFPGTQQGWNVAFSIGNKAYVGVGTAWMGCVANATFSQFYEYTPATNTWKQVATFPGVAGSPLSYWSIGGKGYVVDNTRNIYEYDPNSGANGTWTLLNCPFPGAASSFATALVIGGRVFVVNGINGETWEFLP